MVIRHEAGTRRVLTGGGLVLALVGVMVGAGCWRICSDVVLTGE